MVEADTYNQSGDEAGTAELPDAVFARSWNPDLVHQVVVSMQQNARRPVAHTKDRSEVAGGGRKPWRQKGTGRARHGSIRSPLWAGGGQTFGPRNERDFSRSVNKKMRREALFATLSKKLSEDEVLFVNELDFNEPKTADAKEVLERLSEIDGFGELLSKRNNAAFIALPERDENVFKSFHNFGNIEVDEIRNLNPVDILEKKFLIIVNPEESIKVLSEKLSASE